MKTFVYAGLLIFVYLLLSYGLNLPKDVGLDVPEGKLNSLSFAPFREGQGPLDEVFPSAAEIEADLQLMASKTHNIRTYASSEGTMPLIPALARKHGLTMIQGAWLSADKVANAKEIAALIQSANDNPDVVKRVIVGNEVLLRGDLKPADLLAYIRQVQAAVQQPVSYADVWSEYMKFPQLVKEVDYVTIHILPYWEDKPISVEDAPAHIERIFKQVQQEAYAQVPNIPILIGESGWPSAGRQRGNAIPSVVNEAKFIRGFIKVATNNGFDYNIVEAINQSWKSELEGVVGANWGLYSVEREQVFPLTGKVYEEPNWLQHAGVSIALFLGLLALCWRPLQGLEAKAQIGVLLFMQVSMVLLVQQSSFLWYTSYSHWQRAFTLLQVVLNIGVVGLSLNQALLTLRQQGVRAEYQAWLYKLLLAFAVFAGYKTLSLAYDGRYISFPIVSALVPVWAVLALWVLQVYRNSPESQTQLDINVLTANTWLRRQWDKKIGYVLPISALLLLLGETKAFVVSRDFIKEFPDVTERLGRAVLYTVTNQQLLLWLACLAVLALPFWCSGKRLAR